MSIRSNWRDAQEWSKFGTPLSTTSNEACKLFDAVLSQYVGWYDDQSVGGLEKSAEKMLAADPNFVMGHVLSLGLDVMGTGRTVRLDNKFDRDIYNMAVLADKQGLSGRERKHVNAVKLWADGESTAACQLWEDILLENPLDLLALKFAHDSYFYLGYLREMRDSIARVLPRWKPSMPLYGYLLGMYSFGLEETNLFQEAEQTARKGLEINASDAWSTHTMAHVMEMTGRQDEGIAFMSSTESDWSKCGMLACHNYWHWSLYNIEKGNYEAALGILDTKISPCSKSGAMLDIVDVASMLTRLEMEGVNVGSRWEGVFETCRPHLDDHILSFNNVHVLMACLGAKQKEATQQMMESIREFVRHGRRDNCDITREVGLAICEAFVAYNEGNFAQAVDILYPVRYKIIKIGGSNAQDIFKLFLIQAALKSSSKKHHCLARHLLMERKVPKESAPMTDRLMSHALAIHCD